MRPSRFSTVVFLLAAGLAAQANAVPGTDLYLYDVGSVDVQGRRGPAYPGGELGITYGHGMCNNGTVHIPWLTTNPGSTMLDVHFKIAFLVAKEANGRMVQVTTPETCVKHGRHIYNLGPQCGPCSGYPSNSFGIGCFDAYTATPWNADRYNLGPKDEVDPWLGTWDPVGSYFDRGDPAVGGAAATDGVQSLTNGQTNAFDSVKNRIVMRESELVGGGTFWGQVQAVCEGEPLANRANNVRHARLAMSWTGSSWSVSNQGSQAEGSVLTEWTGATVAYGSNGSDDGRLAVAVKVTGPTAGLYHYEYAVHNIDNSRGAAAFRIPLSSAITVSNVGFRDIDTDPLNEWTFSQSSTELAWTAAATNPLDWNEIYNFYFDSPTAPGSGAIVIDQARVGPGLLTVAFVNDVPGGVPPATVNSIGSPCGDCEVAFYEEFSMASAWDLNNRSATLAFNNGSYDVGTGTSSFQPPTGGALSLGNDAETVVNLPFSLPYPGGSTTQLWICSNGFVSPVAGNGTLWLPLKSLLLAQMARWAPAWHDYDPTSGGTIHFQANASGARVTWNQVANSSAAGTSTFQIQFEPNGNVHYIWNSMSNQGNGYLVGWSPGQSFNFDPGNSDLSTALAAGIGLCSTAPQQINLSASARPLLGTTIQQTTSNIAPNAGVGATLMALNQAVPAQNLTPFGMEGCFNHTVGGVAQLWFPNGAANVNVPFTIPNSTTFSGLQVYSQSFVYLPPLTTLGFIASNAIALQLGAF
ncbi:MAG: hypothetical protein KDE27_21385 [Planctomycetes bacterium]|nr:hypothetical protein [Planctomycetota bacterium]